MRDAHLAADYRYCQAVQRHFGKSYYFATRFFPPEVRRHVYALYAFVRLPDQWVDEPSRANADEIARHIDEYERTLRRALAGQWVDEPVLRAFAHTARVFEIPERYMHDFLNAMRMDLYRTRYRTYAELRNYMWGSAAVVGAMMLCLFRCHDEKLLPPATRMGEAMQMTNFLRDVGEDWRRGRIYLPEEDMHRAGHRMGQAVGAGHPAAAFRDRTHASPLSRGRDGHTSAAEGIPLPGAAGQPPLRPHSRSHRKQWIRRFSAKSTYYLAGEDADCVAMSCGGGRVNGHSKTTACSLWR